MGIDSIITERDLSLLEDGFDHIIFNLEKEGKVDKFEMEILNRVSSLLFDLRDYM